MAPGIVVTSTAAVPERESTEDRVLSIHSLVGDVGANGPTDYFLHRLPFLRRALPK